MHLPSAEIVGLKRKVAGPHLGGQNDAERKVAGPHLGGQNDAECSIGTFKRWTG